MEEGLLQPETEPLILKHALVNAIKHGGKAEVGAVISKVLGERPEFRPLAKELIPIVKKVVEEVNLHDVGWQKGLLVERFPQVWESLQQARAEEKGLQPLPNAELGKLVVRLPPEPSGYMHIGHAMAGLINYMYAQMYEGKVWLRFEDTNPRKVKPEYYESFREGYRWLGIKWDYEKNVSDDLEHHYSEGERLIRLGHAYACRCPTYEIKRKRFQGIGCACREKDQDESLEDWRRMLKGEFEEGEVVIRLKGDMKSEDPSFRDPNIFRIIEYPHPIQGSRYRVWPTYDFAVVVEDHLCKVTHVLRSMEFHLALQDWLRKLLGYPAITVIQFSRFKFAGTPVSKRLLRPLIESGKLSGWDDPRMPTVSGLRRRGILPEAIKEFTLTVGYTKTEHEFEWELLFAQNRKLLDPIAKRYFFVPNPIRLEVKDAPRLEAKLRLHPDKDLGFRVVDTKGSFFVPNDDVKAYRVGDVFRLMEAYNVRIEEKQDSLIKASYVGSEVLERVPKIQWVTDEYVKFTVLIPGPIFIGERFNEESLRKVEGFAEMACQDLKVGELVQFSRFGFCRIDGAGTAILTHK